MKISVIIPTYNRASLLETTLRFLLAQTLTEEITLEVIVVDDGSSDNTHSVVEQFRSQFDHLVYRFRPRDSLSCRSRARNLGIESARGELLVFLDCGVVLPSNCFNEIYQCVKNRPGTVLIHRVAGLFVNEKEAEDLKVEALTPSSLAEIIDHLLLTPSWGCWGDSRDGLIFSVDGELDRMPAPWALAWTAFLTVPTALTRKVGGFDESFLKWGAEDTDFAYRLYREGAKFYCKEDIAALHLPHAIDGDSQTKDRSNRANVRAMYARYRTFETEIFCCFPSINVNHLLTRFWTSYSRPWLESPELAEILNIVGVTSDQPSVVLGSDTEAFLRTLTTTHIFWLNPLSCRRLRRVFPDRTIENRLGVTTEYPDKFFASAFVTDFYRGFGIRIFVPVLEELIRIAYRVYVCFSSDAEPRFAKTGEEYVSIEDLKTSLDAIHFRLAEINHPGAERVFRVESRDDFPTSLSPAHHAG